MKGVAPSAAAIPFYVPSPPPSPPKKKKRRNRGIDSINLLSWNIAECRPSDSAPPNWHVPLFPTDGSGLPTFSTTKSSDLIRQEILRHSPDVLALQECPDPYWADANFADRGYVSMGCLQTHCGYTQLMLSDRLAGTAVPVGGLHDNPSVAATVAVPSDGDGERRMTFASSHLAPFKQNALIRLRQIRELMNALPAGDKVLLGDMNMRVAEDEAVEGMGLTDAWKAAGSDRRTKNTWDSYVNKYHKGGFEFKCRFDRVYISSGSIKKGGTMVVLGYSLVGNTPLGTAGGGSGHFLSDHHAIFVRLGISI